MSASGVSAPHASRVASPEATNGITNQPVTVRLRFCTWPDAVDAADVSDGTTRDDSAL